MWLTSRFIDKQRLRGVKRFFCMAEGAKEASTTVLPSNGT